MTAESSGPKPVAKDFECYIMEHPTTGERRQLCEIRVGGTIQSFEFWAVVLLYENAGWELKVEPFKKYVS
tara:strand:- start:383 stop:592 length:210 start_codon:yes stop_codon:yes gene_type:complete